ncbi:hypothetical protein LEP1GSC125_3012 [Leptospira mayottensis 200901122]|uniref:Uncharacterized protein n=1 Tax=Leptospira mayottensis 200901122 TaxID=1193010 RepID=A0AA87MRD6_9LEPT|nr:hypothetical protein LEP1GSC125_3012 [Leptospira mayottensis 200901122]
MQIGSKILSFEQLISNVSSTRKMSAKVFFSSRIFHPSESNRS